jgi:chromosome segregation ATPase
MEKEISITKQAVDQLEKEAKVGIESLTSSVDKVTVELKQMIDHYNDSIIKIQQEIKNKEKVHAQKVNLVYQLKEQINDKQKQRQQLIQKNAIGIKEIEALNASIEGKKGEINKLKGFNAELESDCETLLNTKVQLKKELEQLHQKLSTKEHENKKVHDTKHDIDLRVTSVRDKIRDARERLSMYEAKITSLKDYIGSQELILKKENQQVDRLSKDLQNADTTKQYLEEKRDTLQSKISNLVKTRENLSSDQRVLDERINHLIRQKNDLISTKKSIESSIIDSKKDIFKSQTVIAKTTAEINKVTTINHELRAKAKNYETVKKQQEVKLASLKEQLFKATKLKEHALFDLEKVKRERTQLSRNLEEISADIKNKVSEKNGISHQVKAVSAEIESYKLKLENARTKVIKLQKHNKDSSVEYSLLQKKLNTLRQQYIEETELVRLLENDKTTIEANTSKIRKEIEMLHNKYAYSKTYRKNLEHIIAEKSKLQKESIFEKDGAESVVRYLGTDNMSAKALEKILRDKYVFLDVKANYLMSEISLATIEKYEVFVEDFYNFALEKMDNNTSPMAIIKNYDNNMLNTSFTLFLDPTEDESIKQTLERVEAKYGHKLQCFINRSGKKVTIDLFV